jgi:hypothetical protein
VGLTLPTTEPSGPTLTALHCTTVSPSRGRTHAYWCGRWAGGEGDGEGDGAGAGDGDW